MGYLPLAMRVPGATRGITPSGADKSYGLKSGTVVRSGEMSWQIFSRFGSGNASMRVAMAWSLRMKTGTLYLRAMLTASMAV